jgi:hypothetical protein
MTRSRKTSYKLPSLGFLIPSRSSSLIAVSFFLIAIALSYNTIKTMYADFSSQYKEGNSGSDTESNTGDKAIPINLAIKSDKTHDLRRGEAIGVGFNDGPERPNPYTSFPISVSTQGESPFALIGYLHKDGIDGAEDIRLPFYGRPLYSGSQKWNYYTKDDSRNIVVIPIETQNDKEIMDGESVSVQTYEGNFIAHLYDVQVPRYIPYII